MVKLLPGLVKLLCKYIKFLTSKKKEGDESKESFGSFCRETYNLIFKSWFRSVFAFTMITWPESIWMCFGKEWTPKGTWT